MRHKRHKDRALHMFPKIATDQCGRMTPHAMLFMVTYAEYNIKTTLIFIAVHLMFLQLLLCYVSFDVLVSQRKVSSYIS